MTDTPVKLCRKCVHSRLDWSFFPALGFMRKWARCALALAERETDPVTGKPVTGARHTCKWQRDSDLAHVDSLCGPSGKYWEGR